MSKAVLISIQPKWCELIASGKKTIEVRKTRPKLETPFKCYMYMSAYHWAFSLLREYGMEELADRLMHETGEVIGEFVCDTIHEIKNLGNAFKVGQSAAETNNVARATCLDFGDMHDYLGNKGGYGWHISNLRIYEKPLWLSQMTVEKRGRGFYIRGPVTRQPQSWMYVEEME